MPVPQLPDPPIESVEDAVDTPVRRRGPAGPEFVAIGHYRASAGQHAAPHRHAPWKLTRYHSGSIDTYVDGVRHPVTAGSVLVVPPGSSHAEQANTGYSNTFLLLDAPRQWPWPSTVIPDRDAAIGHALAALSTEAASSDRLAATMISALITRIDVILRRSTAAAGSAPAVAVVAEVERLFARRHTESLRIADVADQVAVSVSTLRTYFDRVLGTSPQARLRQIRLQQAIILLSTSDHTVEAIAAQSGYHSASHLSRHLKEVDGRSPGQLRASGLNPTRTTQR